jgi:maltokinase
MKDVTGMLRSFDYASRSALSERHLDDVGHLEGRAEAWSDRNRRSFVDGYLGTEGAEALVPSDPRAYQAVLDAFELEKAVYELNYERAYRPDWVHIPEAAMRRLTGG